MTKEERQKEREEQVSRGERFWDMADLEKNLSVHAIITLVRVKMRLASASTEDEVFHACCYAYYGPSSCNGKDFMAEAKRAHQEKKVPLYVGRLLLVDPEPV